jgi:hypothetical protein
MGDASISLGLVQCLSVIGYYSLLSILYLGQHLSNLDVNHVNNELLSWLWVSKNRKAASASGVHWKACFSSVSLVKGFAMLAKPDINRL